MFRTKDFVLFFTTIVFLLVAIAGTSILRFNQPTDQSEYISPGPVSDQEFKAEITEADKPSKEERLAALRKKIAESSEVYMEEPDAPEPDEEIRQTTTTEVAAVGELLLCPGFAPFAGLWSAENISVEEREGALVAVSTELRSSTSILAAEEVLLQIPRQSFPLLSKSCIASDVIGLAQDGSLIRNDEVGIYKIFDSTTLIGYALDGFPIYGQGSEVVDQCGGLTVGGQYRYQLTSERTMILNCFSGVPTSL